MNILTLPIELQSHILSFLPWHDHFLVSTVCTLWSSILQRHGLRLRRHYNHPVPASWDTVDHPYPVFDSPSPRVSSDLYTPTDAPNTHVLLERAMLMFEIHENGLTTVFMKMPNDLVSGSLSDNYEVLRVDEGTAESHQYSEFWSSLAPPDSVLINITHSPLLKSDKLIFSIQESDSLEGIDTSGLQIPGLPDSTRLLGFTIWDWNRNTSQFQTFGTLPSGVGTTDPLWCLKQWDWARKSPMELVEMVKEHLRTHVWCNTGVERCFVQVGGFNVHGDVAGQRVDITVGAFPRAG